MAEPVFGVFLTLNGDVGQLLIVAQRYVNMSRTGDAVAPDSGSNTLVLASPDDLESKSWLDYLFRSSSSGAVTPVLVVSSVHSPTEILDEWRTRTTELPTDFAIITLDDLSGSPSSRATTSDTDGVSVTNVPISDLTAIASSVDESLTERSGGSVPLLWFDSVTTLVRATSLETSFRFLHLLTKRVQAAETIAYYRLDPTAYGRETVSSLTPLFDIVLE